jgi:EpsI family protein
MFSSTAIRVYIIVALIPLTGWSAQRLGIALEPPAVEMPDWTFADMPRQLGDWRGEDSEGDPKINVATEAKLDTIVNRTYRDNDGHTIEMHTAMFDNPKGGVYHSPLNCYRSQGWEKVSQETSDIQIDDELTLPVSVTRWKQKNEQRVVIYWYQLGEHVLFGRWDLGIKVRWSLAGKPAWPALIKVMMEIPVTSTTEEAEDLLLGFAERVAKWENQTGHRYGKGMLGPRDGTVAPKSAIPP